MPSSPQLRGAFLFLLTCAATLPVATAEAGEYTVHQCATANVAADDARYKRVNGGDYAFGRHCGQNAHGNSLQVRNISSAPRGNRGEISWVAPGGTRIHAVRATANLRSDAGHKARLLYRGDTGAEAGRIAAGADAPGGFTVYADRPATGRRAFAATLRCESGPRCPASDQARTWLREVQLTLRDTATPTVSAGGALLAAGWRRGSAALSVSAADRGSGLSAVGVTVNGTAVAPGRALPCAALAGARARLLRPCPSAHAPSATLSTGRPPFVDGTNRLRVCAADFGAGKNQTCLERTVMVDNSPPRLTFSPRNPADPELIQVAVAERHSGLAAGRISLRPQGGGEWQPLPTTIAGGELRARVDSSSYPAGRYRFRAGAFDRAGNFGAGERDGRGEAVVLQFPLRERSVLAGALRDARGGAVPYGKRARWSGRLLGARGRGLAGQEVLVIERFAAGASPERRERVVRTDRRGRYSIRLAAGPSRRVSTRFRGSRRYLPSGSRSRRLDVRGRAALRLSRRSVRAGGRVGFRASVGVAGVALAPRGKLVELQARERGAGRWRTVRQALHTNGSGRLRTSYRFERFYRRAVVYRFRLKVTSERGWPYAGPVFSRARTLTVRPR